jgi:nicotinamide riboside transporter PnuC
MQHFPEYTTSPGFTLIEKHLSIIVPLFFMWQYVARVVLQLFVFLLATYLSTFRPLLQSQRAN